MITNRPFHGIFQVLIKTTQQIFIDTAGKSGLELGNLPSLKPGDIALNASEDIALQKREILQTLNGGGHELAHYQSPPQASRLPLRAHFHRERETSGYEAGPPTILTNVCKILRLCEAISSLVFNKSRNVVPVLCGKNSPKRERGN